METISYNPTGPKAFILGTDGLFCDYQKDNDQIWSLHLDGSDTKPFYLETTYNLRAKCMRLFLNFVHDHRRLTKLEDFERQPTVTHYTPATLQVQFRLRVGVDIQFECFIPEPEVLVGSIQITNITLEPIHLAAELAAILLPMGEGMHSRPEKHGNNQIITGQTDNLCPVLFMSGGPVAISSPYPALSKMMEIPPQKSHTLTWSLVSKDCHTASLKKAQKVIGVPWQRDAQRHRMRHAKGTIRIKTGDPDWDSAFCLSQTIAMKHLVKPPPNNTEPFFIRTRLPDQGTSQGQTWGDLDDLTTLEAIHLAQVLLPAHVDLLSAVVTQFLDRQDENGRLPSRLNHSAFSPAFQECPLLAHLSLEIFEVKNDKVFLEQMFPGLRRLFQSWLNPQDGIDDDFNLAWQNSQQCQLDTGLFTFDIWEPTGRGLDIKKAESPAVAAMLYRETRSLHKIALILEDKEAQKQYEKLEKSLQRQLGDFWHEKLNTFTYRDCQSHLTPARELVYPGSIQKNFEIKKVFSTPQRLQLHLFSADENTRNATIRFEGETPDGEPLVEVYKNRKIRWVIGRAHLTTDNLFGALHTISFDGMRPEDRFLLETADLCQTDITCLSPLWSGGISTAHQRALLKTRLDPADPSLKFGIPETWESVNTLPEDLKIRVNVLWNSLIIDGLVREGYQQEAVALFRNLMSTIISGLKDHEGFYPFYDNENGCPSGRRNAIGGLAPMRLFLNIAGIRLFSPNRVAVWGQNPFPWPIEIQWQGLSLLKDGTKTKINFPNGSLFENNSTKPLVITPLEMWRGHV